MLLIYFLKRFYVKKTKEILVGARQRRILELIRNEVPHSSFNQFAEKLDFSKNLA